MSEAMRPMRPMLLAALIAAALPAAGEAPLVDPMRPPARTASGSSSASVPEATLVLSYTRVAGSQREALIGDRLVREGDAIAGARVEHIERGTVHLRRGTTREVLTLATQTPGANSPPPDKDTQHEE